MIVVHLLLFSVLLYNTEAVFDDEYNKTTTVRSIAIEAAILVEDTTTTNRTETTGKWSYGSGAVEKNETLGYETVPVENPAAVIDKEPANLTYELAVTKPYEDDVGYFTVDNGTVTTHFPKKSNGRKGKSKYVSSHKRDYSFLRSLKKTTSTRRPYYSFLYKVPENYRTTNDSSYYRYNKTVNDSETTSTRRPYYSLWYKEPENYRTTNESSYYRYNQTVNDSETTSTRRPYYSFLYKEPENYRTTTESSYYRYNQTVNDSETTSTRRPYYSLWYKEPENYRTTNESSYYRYNQTVNDSETTSTRRPYYSFLYKEPENYRTTTESSYYRYNQTVNDSETTTTWYNKRGESPIVNRANSSDQNVTTDQVNPKTPYPVNISINSSINANEARNYGAFTDFFKKISGYILPSASNIAPNSNITNLAVVNGNGNLFFFM